MTALLRAQEDFLACLHDDNAPLPSGWDARCAAGMAVYRNAYRTRLIDVLRVTFERTAKLVGDDAFNQAAAHHLITHPPKRWTIDLAGEGFAETCAELFTNDPDVGEVAWLEWEMHRAFTAADGTPMEATDFVAATADFDAGQWEELRLELIPGTAMRPVMYDLVKLWDSLADPLMAPVLELLPETKWVLLRREWEEPVFSLVSEEEGRALADLQRGAPFGSICAGILNNGENVDAASKAGAMLLNWLRLGLLQWAGAADLI